MQLEWVRDEVFLNIFAPGGRGRGAHPLVLSRHKSEAPVGPKVQALLNILTNLGKGRGKICLDFKFLLYRNINWLRNCVRLRAL